MVCSPALGDRSAAHGIPDVLKNIHKHNLCKLKVLAKIPYTPLLVCFPGRRQEVRFTSHRPPGHGSKGFRG